ncbi:hypothetical protein PMZ80_006622 [Knufia obscura]|uniref:Uncharacterized protein n=2 Tax=Knufia TaxID=430999 RepID=A0AAN8F4A3_9EURO|nr:hypothetical protein PMZ80_006622 [Knufia obscura]KAK5950981.1 hypothetical protein OHC33_008053 [Knufia fluminis]
MTSQSDTLYNRLETPLLGLSCNKESIRIDQNLMATRQSRATTKHAKKNAPDSFKKAVEHSGNFWLHKDGRVMMVAADGPKPPVKTRAKKRKFEEESEEEGEESEEKPKKPASKKSKNSKKAAKGSEDAAGGEEEVEPKKEPSPELEKDEGDDGEEKAAAEPTDTHE